MPEPWRLLACAGPCKARKLSLSYNTAISSIHLLILSFEAVLYLVLFALKRTDIASSASRMNYEYALL